MCIRDRDLAKRLGKTKQAVYDMLDKEDVNTSLLRELAYSVSQKLKTIQQSIIRNCY